MGNRAIIKAKNNNNIGVYLHWNGGRDSVEAFLKYCEMRGFRGFENDYGMARFCQIVGNFFGADGLSIGIINITEEDGKGMDNGLYIVEGWKIVERKGFKGKEQDQYELIEMLKAIDEAQPKQQQLGEYITAKEVKTSTIKIGDIVYMKELDGTYKKYTVVGMGEDKFVNGRNVMGIPFVNKYINNSDYSRNPNNYITDEVVRIVTK